MATSEFNFTEFMADQQRRLVESSEQLGQNFRTINTQITGLASAVYLQSVSQVVPVFEGDPSKSKE